MFFIHTGLLIIYYSVAPHTDIKWATRELSYHIDCWTTSLRENKKENTPLATYTTSVSPANR